MNLKSFVFRLFGLVLLLPCGLSAVATTLDQTSVGRFGVGHHITASTANQDLLAWNVVNTGQQIEVRLYDPDGKTVSLGQCGLPLKAGETVQNNIRAIGWTQLVSRYTTAAATLDVRESLLTPALWFHSSSPRLALFQSEPKSGQPAPMTEAIALPLGTGIRMAAAEQGLAYSRARDGRLTRPWFLALVRQGALRFPVLCLLYHTPDSITRLPSGGLHIAWPAAQVRSDLGILPLNGCRPGTSTETSGWERGLPVRAIARADTLAGWFLPIPTGLTEHYRLTDTEVCITNTVTFANQADEWGIVLRTKGYAPVPPAVANARRYGYPARYAQRVTDLDFPTYLGPFCAVRGARALTWSLPLPRLYAVLHSPFTDATLNTLLPAAVTQTIADYSRYVTQAYRNKPVEMYGHSAIGEGRILGSEYPCLRLMTPAARQTFTTWADRAAKRLYNWRECYGYGEETANGRRFLLDNYRIGGKDYIDAGWFGYNIIAMWARSHYAGHWDEARRNWPRIRELFYGWNWTYNDYAALYAPLYLDGENGGNPKGYTDNMGMLPALYAWARMADHLGDRQTRADALYLLARDRIARYNRMAIHAYTRAYGFHTDVNVFTSDMGNGPNIAPSGRFIPPDPARWQTGAITDYGEYGAGLWFLSGSFFEPITSESVDLMRAGTMQPRVAASVVLLDQRFPRWWACPTVGEEANYQIYLRGALFHEDLTQLRYYFDYQAGFQQGVWTAEPWHADAFAGIILSRFYPVNAEKPTAENDFLRRDGARWRPIRDEAEAHLILGKENRRYLALWNATSTPLQTRLRWNRHAAGFQEVVALYDMKRKRSLPLSRRGQVTITLAPGSNLFVLRVPRPPIGRLLAVRCPSNLVVADSETQSVPVTLVNHGRRAQTCQVTARGFTFAGKSAYTIRVPAQSTKVLTGTLRAPATPCAPFAIGFTAEANGRRASHSVRVLTLPGTVALLTFQGEKVARLPQIGTAEIVAHNRRTHPVAFHFRWSLDGKTVVEQTLTLPAATGKTWEIPLRPAVQMPGKYRSTLTVDGAGIAPLENTRELLFLGPPGQKTPFPRIVLYGFERDTEAWFLPDWPDANKDSRGNVFRPARSTEQAHEGKGSLKTMLNLAAGRASGGFLSVRPNFDWTPFRRASVDVYLPPNAPAGLTARFYMMGDRWRWREAWREAALTPGQWTTVEIALEDPQAAADWKRPTGDIGVGLKNVLDIGVNIRNSAPYQNGYLGPVYLDNFQVELR